MCSTFIKRKKPSNKPKTIKERLPIACPKLQADLTAVRKELHRVPVEEELQNQLADELVEWAKEDDAWVISQFCSKRLISEYRFKRLCDKNEYFNERYQEALMLLKARIELAGILGTTKMTHKDAQSQLYFVSEAHRQAVRDRMSAFKDSLESHHTYKVINVAIPSYPKSPLVPDRKKEKE